MTRDCTCDECVLACKRQPGWFMPGEAEKAAALLGMEFAAFREQYLIIEYWFGDESTEGADVDVLAPRKLGVDVGEHRASWAAGFTSAPCVFLDEQDRCRIHAAKPRECREAMCCEVGPAMDELADKVKAEIVAAWQAVGGAR